MTPSDPKPSSFHAKDKTTDDSKNGNLEKVGRIYSFWGRFPLLYDAQDVITFFGRATTIRKKTVEQLHLKIGDRVLEMACGSGRNFPYLVETVTETGSIIGFDYSHDMLRAAEQLCKRNEWNNVKLVQGDAATLNIIEKNFDGVISVLGISAIPDWENALNRCHDVLRLGGRLVVCDARLFTGFLAILNPLIRLIYFKFAAWDPSKNIQEKMETIFGNVTVKHFNLGTFFIATAVKKE